MRPYLIAAGLLAFAGGALWFGLGDSNDATRSPAVAVADGPLPVRKPLAARHSPSIASLPDRGNLVAFDRTTPPRRASAYTWHPVALSEEHAIRAVATGEMEITAPDGQPIRLQYARHVEHADGNWTWIGRPPGAKPGIEAIITFGEKAVFGTIPFGPQPLRLTTQGGRVWMMETDAARLATLDNFGAHPRGSDMVLPPASRRRAASGVASADAERFQPAPAATTAAAATAANTVDLLLGYTATFAQRLGGQSQAVTRLTYMVDVANQAYANSQIAAQVRLVRTMQVSYPDATANKDALYALSGVSCTDSGCVEAAIPAALQPLHAARDQYGADLVSLVRNFNDPENDGCGIAWVIGGEQTPIAVSDEYAGMSVVSDSNGTSGGSFPDNGYVCRDETLAHELGHNMGLSHDRTTAADTDDSNGDGNLLDPDEYGRYPYSFGYRTNSPGNFFTVMAYRESGSSQVQNRVFSNPQLSICGPAGAQVHPCGVASQADNARSLRDTIPIIASFRAAMSSRRVADFNGDGTSDVLWRNSSTGGNVVWRSASSATQLAMAPVASQAWQVAGVGDFDADGASDVLWRNSSTGGNVIWRSASSRTQLVLPTVALSWSIAGVGDFDGDGRSDILWRSTSNGSNVLWKSANSRTQLALAAIADQGWRAAAVADFTGDGKADILWRHQSTGNNVLWPAATSGLQQALARVADTNWIVAGAGDFNGDGAADVLWRNRSTGANTLWRSASSQQSQVLTAVAVAWDVAAAGDYNGDGKADIFWRNRNTGANAVWRSANSTTQQPTTTVADLSWQVSS